MDRALELSKKYKTLLTKYGITTPLRLAHFFAQLAHESGLKPISENLNYSVEGLRKTFAKYFPTNALAIAYARQPKKIANRVYANRMGNRSETSGDGWLYRGRGFIQITGRNNYTALTRDTGVDYLKNPDLLLTEADSMIAALWYWKTNNLNKYADLDDLDAISDIINLGRMTPKEGDSNGFKHRKEMLDYYKEIF